MRKLFLPAAAALLLAQTSYAIDRATLANTVCSTETDEKKRPLHEVEGGLKPIDFAGGYTSKTENPMPYPGSSDRELYTFNLIDLNGKKPNAVMIVGYVKKDRGREFPIYPIKPEDEQSVRASIQSAYGNEIDVTVFKCR